MSQKKNCLQIADELIHGDRQDSYGHSHPLEYTCKRCGRVGVQGDGFYSYIKKRCKQCLAEIQRAYRKTRPKHYWNTVDRRYTIKKRYGLSIEDFERMITAQNYKCAICGEDPRDYIYSDPRKQKLHIDHCHTTGKVRALLCNGCNRALGLINENIEKAKSLVRYLEEYCATT
jgi:hypothetical protein